MVDEVYLLTDVRYRKSDFLTKTSSVSLRLPPSPKGKVNITYGGAQTRRLAETKRLPCVKGAVTEGD